MSLEIAPKVREGFIDFSTNSEAITNDGGAEGFGICTPERRPLSSNGLRTELPAGFRIDSVMQINVVYSLNGEADTEKQLEIDLSAFDLWSDGMYDRSSNRTPGESRE